MGNLQGKTEEVRILLLGERTYEALVAAESLMFCLFCVRTARSWEVDCHVQAQTGRSGHRSEPNHRWALRCVCVCVTDVWRYSVFVGWLRVCLYCAGCHRFHHRKPAIRRLQVCAVGLEWKWQECEFLYVTERGSEKDIVIAGLECTQVYWSD